MPSLHPRHNQERGHPALVLNPPRNSESRQGFNMVAVGKTHGPRPTLHDDPVKGRISHPRHPTHKKIRTTVTNSHTNPHLHPLSLHQQTKTTNKPERGHPGARASRGEGIPGRGHPALVSPTNKIHRRHPQTFLIPHSSFLIELARAH